MKKYCLLILTIFCFSARSKAQNTFEKVIDTLGSAGALCIQETFDGGYVYCGKSNYGGNDAMIVKMDSIGTIEWAKVYSGPGVESATYIEQTPDSGYMVNALFDGGGLYSKSWLLRLDVNGDTLWTKTISVGTGATRVDNGNSMTSINNTVYGLTGYFQPVPLTIINAYFIACLSNGTLIANKQYNTSPFQTGGYAIDNTFDSGFIISGWFGTSTSTTDFYLIRTDAYGDTLWTKTYDNSQNDAGQTVEQTADSGFIVAGFTWNSTAAQYNVYLLKTDSIGDTLWSKQYGGASSSGAYSVQQTADGGYIATGRIVNGNPLTSDIYLIKTNSLGDTLWTRQFGDSPEDDGYFVRQTKDGGYIICGIGSSLNSVASGTYIIKTDSLGHVPSGVGITEINAPFAFNIYPNPSSGIFTIQLNGLLKKNPVIEVYNLTNECIYTCELQNHVTEQINLSKQPNGLYVIMLRTKEKTILKKIAIQN